MSGRLPVQLLRGDPRHGVARYAREIAEATGAPTSGEGPAHLHFTDALWDAGAVERLAHERPVTVTLHDVPQPGEGARRAARRTAIYVRVLRAANGGALCNSHHEVGLLAGVSSHEAPDVIPLPVFPAVPQARPVPRDEVALLGFVYPGKGHAEAIDAVARLPAGARPSVVALGAVADGHELDADRLRARAQQQGVELEITGYLDEDTLRDRARAAAVPLAGHRTASASGSLNSWIAAGRRPLALASPYTREMDALRPGTLWLYGPDELGSALATARGRPQATWLEDGVDTRPHLADVAERYRAWWTR